MKLFDVVKIGLGVSLGVSFVVYLNDTSTQPVSDPWFMPVIFVLFWQSMKH
jgi:hypothetical protein